MQQVLLYRLRKSIQILLAFWLLCSCPIIFGNNTKVGKLLAGANNFVKVRINGVSPKMGKLYEDLQLGAYGLSEYAYNNACKGFEYLKQKGSLANTHIISIIDFTKPSSKKRLFVIDVENEKLLFNTYVAHGQNSGQDYATNFSNQFDSYKSSLGFYRTSSTYMGKNGFSLKLQGLEAGINDNAEGRGIVMHGADYVNEQLIQSQGFIGRSWGCPAVKNELNKPIIEKIKNGTCFFIFGNNNSYLTSSRILHS
jgi:L,D-transpeptidase catalytic domain